MVRLPPDVRLPALSAEQSRLAARVVRRDDFGGLRRLRFVAGVDVTYEGGTALAAAVVVERGTMRAVEEAVASRPEEFPYVPGYLSFRELPVAVDALRRLRTKPQVVMVDAAGVLHPRDLGFASHLGVHLGVPTIGVAKSLLCGELLGEPTPAKPVPIHWHGKLGGYALLTGRAKNPIYVSIGHRVSARTGALLASEMALHRVPEPTRRAHRSANARRLELRGATGARTLGSRPR